MENLYVLIYLSTSYVKVIKLKQKSVVRHEAYSDGSVMYSISDEH